MLMNLGDLNCYLSGVASRKPWKVYESGSLRTLDEGKFKEMVDEFYWEKVLFLDMKGHQIFLRRTKEEIDEDKRKQEELDRMLAEWKAEKMEKEKTA